LYGCKSFSLGLREEHRLRVFENRALRGSGRSQGQLHNDALHKKCTTYWDVNPCRLVEVQSKLVWDYTTERERERERE
jgi:hypothetical protein